MSAGGKGAALLEGRGVADGLMTGTPITEGGGGGNVGAIGDGGGETAAGSDVFVETASLEGTDAQPAKIKPPALITKPILDIISSAPH